MASSACRQARAFSLPALAHNPPGMTAQWLQHRTEFPVDCSAREKVHVFMCRAAFIHVKTRITLNIECSRLGLVPAQPFLDYSREHA